MKLAIKNAMGATLLLSTASSIAQVASATRADCASCPRQNDQVIVPSDPTMLVAFGIFVLGVIAGAALVKLSSGRRDR